MTKFNNNTFLSKLSVTMADAAHHHGFAPCNICLVQASEVALGMTIRYQCIVGKETMRKDVVIQSITDMGTWLRFDNEDGGWFKAKPTDSLVFVGGKP